MIEVYYGDNRFGTVTDSGTATLKPRPRVRPLLTFLPLVSARLTAGLELELRTSQAGCCSHPHPRGTEMKNKPTQTHSVLTLGTRD